MRNSIGHFSLYGDFELEEITAALSLKPSSVTPRGTLYEGAEFPSKVLEWELYCPEELTMSQQLEFLINALSPCVDALQRLAKQHTADFNLSGEGSEVIEIKAAMLDKLAKFHVNLNCFFNLTGDNDIGNTGRESRLDSGSAENKGTR